MRPEVAEEMVRCFGMPAGDPGRVHTEGRIVRQVIEEAREEVARFLGTRPRQVVFTSGGTEAINAATWGATRAKPGCPVILAPVEHSAVRRSAARSAPVIDLPVEPTARIDPAVLRDVLDEIATRGLEPALVNCQVANHEVGTMQPFKEVVDLCRSRGVLVHLDACAAAGHIALSLDDLGADLVSVSAHKMGGPPGAGALVVRRGLRLEPFVVGGEQERARRAGFENVAAMLGFGAVARTLADGTRLASEIAESKRLTDRLRCAAAEVPGVEIVGAEDGLAHIVCLTIAGVEGEPVLLALDQGGVAAQSGSSCSSEELAPSPVLEAMGVDAERSLRLSVGWSSIDEDVNAFIARFGPAVDRLRSLR